MGDGLHKVAEIHSDVFTTVTVGDLPLIAERLQSVYVARCRAGMCAGGSGSSFGYARSWLGDE